MAPTIFFVARILAKKQMTACVNYSMMIIYT